MSTNNEKTVNEQYLDLVKKKIESVQQSGDIPEMFTYSHEGHNWVLLLPRSVMAQKRLVHLRNAYLISNSYEAEEALLQALIKNAKMDGHEVGLEQLTMGEIEVFKKSAYKEAAYLLGTKLSDEEIEEYIDSNFIDKTKLSPARILVSYVVIGVLLGAIGIYGPIVDFAGAGATVPLTGFGYNLAKGVRDSIDQEGFIGIFTGGLKASAGGICAAIIASLIVSFLNLELSY